MRLKYSILIITNAREHKFITAAVLRGSRRRCRRIQRQVYECDVRGRSFSSVCGISESARWAVKAAVYAIKVDGYVDTLHEVCRERSEISPVTPKICAPLTHACLFYFFILTEMSIEMSYVYFLIFLCKQWQYVYCRKT